MLSVQLPVDAAEAEVTPMLRHFNSISSKMHVDVDGDEDD